MSSEDIEEELGDYGGRQYFLRVIAEPGFNQPQDWTVTIYYRTAEGYSNVEIAQIDTAHGYTHFHELYREHQPETRFQGTIWDAHKMLKSNWRRYAKLHSRNHES